MTDLIFDIEKLVKDFHLKSVKLFVPGTYTLHSLAGATALATYLNEVCDIPTTMVAYEEKVEQVSMCLPEVEDPNGIRKNANDFLAIIIDCASTDLCDNDAFNRTFCALQVRGKVSMKDFGVEAYNETDALCAAEIIYEAICAHSDIYYTYCPKAYDYLYLAMLDATSIFKLHMKTNTFEAIQNIIMSGAEVEIKPECFKQKNSNEIKILERIYTNCVIDERLGFTIFSEDQWLECSSSEFQNVLEYIRFVKIVDVWIAFVKTKKGFTAYVQGNATGKFDITKALKKYNCVGSRKKTKFKIQEDQIRQVIQEVKDMISEGKTREKPRKKYTHKATYLEAHKDKIKAKEAKEKMQKKKETKIKKETKKNKNKKEKEVKKKKKAVGVKASKKKNAVIKKKKKKK